MSPEDARGKCPTCGEMFALKGNGAMRHHLGLGTLRTGQIWRDVCDGTDQVPVFGSIVVPFELTTDQLIALRTLLELVHYDDLAAGWLALLPAEFHPGED